MSEVTVLMPVYNAERFVAGSIESILRQSFEDFDFLIIDDASSDRSAEIIRSYGDPRIRYVRNRANLGISATLNRGIEMAGTELIARMDADDISYPDRLAKQVQYLKAHPDCAMTSTLIRNISENGTCLGVDHLNSDFFYYNLTFYCWIYHPTVMYRKAVVQEAGMYPMGFAEDYRLWCRIIREFKFWNIPEVLLDYRVFNQSTSHALRANYSADEKAQIQENLRYFAGDLYSIPDAWLEVFRNNFQPILENGGVRQIAACVRELDFITERIIATKNVNRDVGAIARAAKKKRTHILKRCQEGLRSGERLGLSILDVWWRRFMARSCLKNRSRV